MNKYCECPEIGELGCSILQYDAETEAPYVNHKPNECKCTNDLQLYNRKGKNIYLCSICNLPGDILICN